MPRLNLPTAGRTVRRGLGVCRRMGYTEDQALRLIMSVCVAASDATSGPGEFDLTWLASVHEEARCQLARRTPR